MSWTWLILAGFSTFGLRFAFFLFFSTIKGLTRLPAKLIDLLELIPIAIFWAIIFPAVYAGPHELLNSFHLPAFWALVLAFLGSFFGHILLGIVLGLIAYYGILYFQI